MNLKKIFAGVTTVTCSVMMIGGSAIPAFALTVEELEAQIAELQAQLALYIDQLGDLTGDDDVAPASSYDGIPDGFTFENALYFGMNNTETQYLQIILKAEVGAPTYPDTVGATGYFGSITKASVIEFQEMYADDILAVYGLTNGTGYVGTTTRAKLNELLAAAPADDTADDDDDTADDTADDDDDDDDDVADDGDYSVELSDDNPAANTLMDESAYNEMLVFDATAEDGDWDITSITVERFGISTDSMVSGVLVKDSEGMRHGNVYTFSDKEAEIIFENYPISIEEGKTETISVFYNLGSTATSGTVGAKVTAINGDPDGLPLMGNTFTLADGSSVLGALTVDVVNVATTAVSVDVGTENKLLTRFQFAETTSNEDVYLEELTVYNNGSSADGDILNWELKDPLGNTLAEVAQTDDKYVTFDLTNSPGYRIPNGTSKNLTLYVDVADGSGRTTQAVVLDDYDIVAVGKDTGVRILATGANSVDTSTFPVGDIASGSSGYNTITASAGSLTVSKSNSSPTGTVPAGGNDVLFGTWSFKATGEDMEIRRVDIYLNSRTAPDNGDSGSTANESDDIFSGTVKLQTEDGVTRKSLTVASDVPSTTATAYTLSSYFTVPAGETVDVSIYGNLRTDLSSADSFQFALDDVYYKRMSTGDFQTYGTAKNANTLTGASGSLTIVKDSAWGNKSIIAGTNKQVGQYVIQTGSTEGVNVSSLTVDITSVTGLDEMWLQKGTGDCDEGSSDLIGSVDTSPATTDNIFSTGGDFEIPESGSQTFIVCGNFDTSTATGTYISSLNASDVAATGSTSGESVTNSAVATGQTMTIQTAGVLTVKIGSNPAAQVLRANEDGVQLLDLTFSTLYEPITIDTFRFTVEDDGSQDRNFTNYTLKNGSTIQSGKSAVSGVVTFSGLSETVGYNDSESYSLWADISDVLTIGQDDNARVNFGSVEAIGDWSNSNIMESDENNYLGALTTEPGSDSSVGHYQAGDLVVSIDNGDLRPVVAETNEAVDLDTTGLDLGGSSNETFTTSEEISKFGAVAQAPNSGALTTGIAANDLVVVHDASANAVYNGLVTAVTANTSITVADESAGSTAVTLATGDINVELSGSNVALTGASPTLGDFVAFYDASAGTTDTGILTAALTDTDSSSDFTTTDVFQVDGSDYTVAASDSYFAYSSDVSQEAYSTSSTYQYGVGDIVYHYDASGTSGWGVVKTGIRAGETMANLVTSIATAAASDRIVKFSPGVLSSNVMNIHDGEPVITASSSTYPEGTSIIGAMQTIAIFDIEAIGTDISIESLAVRLEGSGVDELTTSSNAFEIWEGNERIYQGGDVSGAAAATYTCDLTTPEEIQSGTTKTFTVKVNTYGTAWASADVGKSLTAKVNGVKGQSGSGLDWFYTNSQGAGSVPTSASPVNVTDSELPVSGKNNLTY